jgi:hypothetical protein
VYVHLVGDLASSAAVFISGALMETYGGSAPGSSPAAGGFHHGGGSGPADASDAAGAVIVAGAGSAAPVEHVPAAPSAGPGMPSAIYVIDPVVTIAIATFVIAASVKLALRCALVLLEATPKEINIVAVERLLRDVPGVISVHELHVWSLDDAKHCLEAHLVSNSQRPTEVLGNAHTLIRAEYGITRCCIQVEHPERRDNLGCTQVIDAEGPQLLDRF